MSCATAHCRAVWHRSSSRGDHCRQIRPPAGCSKAATALRRRHRLQALAAAADPSPPSAAAASSSAAQLKQALLQAVSRSNNPRAGESQLQLEREVESLAEQLAAVNPTPAAATSPLINGAWALLWSGRSQRLASAAAFPTSAASAPSLQEALQAASDSAYSIFYKYVPVLTGSAVGARRGSSATNLQVIYPGRVDNVVRTSRGLLPLRLCVSGSVETVKPPAGRPASCVAVCFDRFTVKVGSLPATELSLGWLRPLGCVDTLYLDEEMRVSVGDKGGLFVLRKAAGDGEGGEAAGGGAP